MIKFSFSRFGFWAVAGTYCGDKNWPSPGESNMESREIVRIVWRWNCESILRNMHKNVSNGRREEHLCIWFTRKVLFKTILEKNLRLSQFWNVEDGAKFEAELALVIKEKKAEFGHPPFPISHLPLFPSDLLQILLHSMWVERTGCPRSADLLCYLAFMWAWTST